MDDGLKQRLIGAVVLAAVAVLFVPVLFDRDERRRVDTTTQIPPRPDIQPKTYNSPKRVADVSPAPNPETMFTPVDDVQPAPVTVNPSKPKLNQPVAKVQLNAAKLDPLNANGLPNAWVVQVISSKSKGKAKNIVKTLNEKGYKAYFRKAMVANADVYRVYVGPNVDKTKSKAIKKTLDSLLKIDARVLRFQP